MAHLIIIFMKIGLGPTDEIKILIEYYTPGESLYSGVACLRTDPFANFLQLFLLHQIIHEFFY